MNLPRRPLLTVLVLLAGVLAAQGELRPPIDLTQGLIHYWDFDRADDTGGHPPKRIADGAGDMPLLGYRKSGAWLTEGVVGKALDRSSPMAPANSAFQCGN